MQEMVTRALSIAKKKTIAREAIEDNETRTISSKKTRMSLQRCNNGGNKEKPLEF